MTDLQTAIAAGNRAEAIAALGLTVTAVFVPFSQSPYKADKKPSLNWRVTVQRFGRDVLTCNYNAAAGWCPASRTKPPASYTKPDSEWVRDACRAECEKGRAVKTILRSGEALFYGTPIMPEPLDVLYCLNSDADALNYATFEAWASETGVSPDSRSGEAVYRACLEIGLKLRAALGDAGLTALNEILQDY